MREGNCNQSPRGNKPLPINIAMPTSKLPLPMDERLYAQISPLFCKTSSPLGPLAKKWPMDWGSKLYEK